MAGRIKGITVEIGGDTSKLSRALNQLNRPIYQMQGELRRVDQLLKLNPGNAAMVKQKFTLLSSSIEETENKLKELRAAMAQAEAAGTNEKNSASFRKLQREIEETENKLKELRAEEARFKVMGGSAGIAAQKIGQIGDKATEAGNKLRALSAATGLIGTIGVASVIEYESAFAGVTKTVDGTEKQLSKIRQGILRMAQSTSSSSTDIAAVAEAAGQLGIKTPDILNFTKTMVQLGDTTNLSAEEAASSLAKFANITGMLPKNYSRLGSTIVDLGNNFATTEADIVAMGTNLASTGKLAGLTEPQIMALATAMSSVGIEAQAGGTAMSKLLKSMQVAVETGGGELKKFASVSGMSAKQFQQAFQQDAVGAMSAFISGLNDTERNGKSAIAVLDEMGIKEARLSNTILALASSGDLLTNAIDTANGAWKKNTAMAEEAEKRYQTTAAQLSQLKETAKEAAINLGDVMLPTIRKTATGFKKLTGAFADAPKPVKKFTAALLVLGGVSAPTLLTIGAMAKGVRSTVSTYANMYAKIKTGEGVLGRAAKSYNKLKAATLEVKKANEAAAKAAAISGPYTKTGTAVQNFTKQQKLLNLALKAAPYAAAAAALVALGATIYKVHQEMHKETVKAKENAEAREKSVAAIKSETKESNFYLQKLNELSGVENKTLEQKQLMKTYVDKLNKSVEGLNLQYDAEKDKLNQTTDAIYKKIQAQREAALAEQYQKNASKALKEYADAQIKAADAKRKYNQLTEKWNSLSASEKQANSDLVKQRKYAKQELDDYNGKMAVALQDATKWNNQAAIQSGAWKSLSAEAKKAGITIPKSLKDGIESGKYVIPQTVDELQALVKFDKMSRQATGKGKKVADKLAAELRAGTITVEEATKKLQKSVGDELKKDTGAGKSGAKAGKEYAAAVEQGKPAAKKAAEALVRKVKEGADKPKVLYGTGRDIAKGLNDGMRSMLNSIRRTANAIVDAANKAAKARAIVGSPSRLFRDSVGVPIAEGVAVGMHKGKSKIAAAATDMIATAEGSSTLKTSFNTSGTSSAIIASAGIDYNKLAAVVTTAIRGVQLTPMLVIDGKVITQAIAPHMDEELNRLKIRANRKRGHV